MDEQHDGHTGEPGERWDDGGDLALSMVDDGPPTEERVEALVRRCGGRVPLDVLLDDLPRRLRRCPAPGRAVHEAWRFDGADQRDLRWWPQGVSSDADAAPLGGVAAERRLAITTWYAKKLPWDAVKHGARVTLMDLDALRYRHVLLVKPTERGVEPLDVHAGGIVWHAGRLLVAGTGGGLHVARLADLVRSPAPGVAFGYRYLLPVSGRLGPRTPSGVEKLRYSFVSLDRSDPGRPALLVGEYGGSLERTRRLARIALEPGSGLPADGRLEPTGSGPLRMQGVAELGGQRWLSVSEGRRRRGSLYVESPDGGWRHVPKAVPMGNEDLAADPAAGTLHTITEHPFARWLVTVRPS